MRKRMKLIALAGLALAGSAQAADFGVYATAGTIGLGGGVTATFGSHVGARLGYTAFEYDVKDLEQSNLVLDGTARLGGIQGLVDWYPFGGSFRLSVGAMQSPELSAHAKPIADTYTFGGTTYSASDIGHANGTAAFDSIAPYAGIGYGRALSSDRRFAFTADLGVAFTDAATVLLDVTCSVPDPAMCALIDDDVMAEQVELQKEADEAKYWPVLSLGLSYRF